MLKVVRIGREPMALHTCVEHREPAVAAGMRDRRRAALSTGHCSAARLLAARLAAAGWRGQTPCGDPPSHGLQLVWVLSPEVRGPRNHPTWMTSIFCALQLRPKTLVSSAAIDRVPIENRPLRQNRRGLFSFQTPCASRTKGHENG